MKELAEWFGLEVARIVVDECLAPAKELNGEVSLQRCCLKCSGYLGIVAPRAEGQDARAGDQRTVLEMWLSADVGIDSREDDTPPPETLFSLVEID